jgi:hypothetical protein
MVSFNPRLGLHSNFSPSGFHTKKGMVMLLFNPLIGGKQKINKIQRLYYSKGFRLQIHADRT